MSTLAKGLATKSIELMHELIPSATAIAFLMNSNRRDAGRITSEIEVAAKAARIKVHVLSAATDQDLETAFAEIATQHATPLVVFGDPFFDSRREKIVALAAHYKLPAAYAWREYVLAGGLLSYGTSITESYRQAAIYAGRILKGEKPGDLPVQEPSKFQLSINTKTATALGLVVPQSILLRADELID